MHSSQSFNLISSTPAPFLGQEFVVLAVHGRNQEPAFMREVVARIGWQHLPALYLEAANKTWYPAGFMAPVAENEPFLTDALHTLDKAVTFLNASGYGPEQIVLVGFSQGACLLSQFVLAKGIKFRAFVGFTGGYVGPEGIDWKFAGNFKAMPVLLTGSEIDEWVPAMRTQKTAQQFQQLGAEVQLHIFKNRPHEVSEPEFDMARKLLAMK